MPPDRSCCCWWCLVHYLLFSKENIYRIGKMILFKLLRFCFERGVNGSSADSFNYLSLILSLSLILFLSSSPKLSFSLFLLETVFLPINPLTHTLLSQKDSPFNTYKHTHVLWNVPISTNILSNWHQPTLFT